MSNEKQYIETFDYIDAYPDAWFFAIWSPRGGTFGAGKTYSTLKEFIKRKIKFIYIKRTNKDVNFLCSGRTQKEVNEKTKYKKVDNSPFKPINRDKHTNIKPLKIDDGYGAFYNCDEEDKPVGDEIGVIFSLNLAKDIKGFDFSDCEFIFWDEFIPQRFERLTNKKEGESFLSIVMTVQRDRIQRGLPPVKVICCANGSDISNPLFLTLEIINDVATMSTKHSDVKYIKNRGMVLVSLFWNVKEEKLVGLEKAMQGTEWFDNNVSGGFTYNDFSNVTKKDIKHMRCESKVIVNKHSYYIYSQNDKIYISKIKSNHFEESYNLKFDNQQKLFYTDWIIDLQYKLKYNNVKVDDYFFYDLIINYNKYYLVR